MYTTTRRVFSSLTRVALIRGKFVHNATPTVGKMNSMQSLALSSQRSANSTDGEEEVDSEPIKFSTSKASHRTWKVKRSLGSNQERSWKKVLPVSLVFTGLLLWAILRDSGLNLDTPLHEHLPNTLSDEEKE
ncbi:hypothetical protein PBY51_001547 [Eleginops maclovinus]|uniref:Protein CCSMST1 n=1 Tax=Eleginops maclovinus TaxID=56733 RepID=A0AAN8AD52_ELEMC|nr:hypothetical protein PBY51_001547 [Eleginops maclovinus]